MAADPPAQTSVPVADTARNTGCGFPCTSVFFFLIGLRVFPALLPSCSGFTSTHVLPPSKERCKPPSALMLQRGVASSRLDMVAASLASTTPNVAEDLYCDGCSFWFSIIWSVSWLSAVYTHPSVCGATST